MEVRDEIEAIEEANQQAAAEAVMPVSVAEASVVRVPSLWRTRDFLLLWSGQTVSTLGSTASGIVFPLLILDITHSPTAAGIAGAIGSVPYLIFSLPVGALIDRWNRKRVMVLCDAGRAAVFAGIPIALFLGVLTIWQLYAAAFAEGTLFVFFNIAEAAALPRVVQRAQIPQANAQNLATGEAAAIIGPTLGTLLYQAVGRMVPFIVDAVSYLASVFSLMLIKTPFNAERKVERRDLRVEIKEGITWWWGRPLFRFMAFLACGINFVKAGIYLVIIVLAQRLGTPYASIGLIFTIGSIGGIVGSVAASAIQK